MQFGAGSGIITTTVQVLCLHLQVQNQCVIRIIIRVHRVAREIKL